MKDPLRNLQDCLEVCSALRSEAENTKTQRDQAQYLLELMEKERDELREVVLRASRMKPSSACDFIDAEIKRLDIKKEEKGE